MPTLLPTHTCFDDALDFIVLRINADPSCAPQLRLVHAIARVPEGQADSGDRFAHAWVEEDEHLVWFAGILDGARVIAQVDRAEFYAQMRIEVATVYTVEEAWAMNAAHHTFGPWDARYQALCRQPVAAARRPPLRSFT